MKVSKDRNFQLNLNILESIGNSNNLTYLHKLKKFFRDEKGLSEEERSKCLEAIKKRELFLKKKNWRKIKKMERINDHNYAENKDKIESHLNEDKDSLYENGINKAGFDMEGNYVGNF